MKLRFDLYKRNRFYGVNIWTEANQLDILEAGPSREYLTEEQYNKIAVWCSATFSTKVNPKRVRRMSYADFWFANQRDLDWFILVWSAIDSKDI